MWVFAPTGFTSAVEFMPTGERLVTAAKYATDPITKVSTKIQDAVYEPMDPEHVEHLKDYIPGTYASKDAEGNDVPGNLCSHLLIRARVKDDLIPLKELDPDAYEFSDMTADYQFRLIIARKAYAQFLYNSAMGIDYNSHFKEVMSKRAPQIQGGRHGGLMAAWSAVSRWQPNPPYGASSVYSYGSYGTGSGYTTYGGSTIGYPAKGSRKWVKDGYVDGVFVKGHWEETVKGKHGSSYDASPWIAPGSGGSSPKAIGTTSGTSVVVTDADKDDEYWQSLEDIDLSNIDIDGWGEATRADLDDDEEEGDLEHAGWLSTVGNSQWWEDKIAEGIVSRATMLAQLDNLLRVTGEVDNFDLQNTVDCIQDAFGTVDIDTLDARKLWDVIDYSKVEFSG